MFLIHHTPTVACHAGSLTIAVNTVVARKQDLKEFYVEDTAKALEEQKDEDVFNEALLKNTRAALKASTQLEIDASGGASARSGHRRTSTSTVTSPISSREWNR